MNSKHRSDRAFPGDATDLVVSGGLAYTLKIARKTLHECLHLRDLADYPAHLAEPVTPRTRVRRWRWRLKTKRKATFFAARRSTSAPTQCGPIVTRVKQPQFSQFDLLSPAYCTDEDGITGPVAELRVRTRCQSSSSLRVPSGCSPYGPGSY